MEEYKNKLIETINNIDDKKILAYLLGVIEVLEQTTGREV